MRGLAPYRVFGTEPSFASCGECHAARVVLSFDSEEQKYTTRVPTLSIDCESCHDPMSTHVHRSQPENRESGSDLAVAALATMSKDESLDVCFRCHALKTAMQAGYLPGKPLWDYYSVGFGELGRGALHPDGRVRDFAYQGSHRYSDCYLSGSMTCVDCHDPHTQEYRDIWGRRLEGRFSDEQCTDCHPSKAEQPERHTFHEPGTDGSRCVDCHMPYLQHPEVGQAVRYARSDHTIAIPRPGEDDRMGVVNACALAGCHADSSLAGLEAVMGEWYGELKPRKPIVDALLRAGEMTDLGEAFPLLDSAAGHPAAQFSAIGVVVSRFLSPDMPRLDTWIERSLRTLAQDEDLNLRAAALAALHLARGEEERTRSFLVRAVDQSESETALRHRWASALGVFGDHYAAAGNWVAAIATYRKALEISPGKPSIMANLGLAQALAGDYQNAVQTLSDAAGVAPRLAQVWLNLGFTLERMGHSARAEQAYLSALSVNASEAQVHLNLGNIYLRRGDAARAIQCYETAVALQPKLGRAHEYLIRAYVAADSAESALLAARRWQRLLTEDPRPQQVIAELEGATRR